MLPVVNDRVAWSVSLCVSHLSHIADRFTANTALCSFNTIQPSSLTVH